VDALLLGQNVHSLENFIDTFLKKKEQKMKRLVALITIVVMSMVLFAETQLANPKPSMENPRKFIFPITTSDRAEINHILGAANNVIKFYGVDNTEVVIVAYSQGITALLKRHDRKIAQRIQSLITYDVEFIACQNTMDTLKIEQKELLNNVEVVTAGIVELIERQLRGYIYIRP
jgi:intracellular sulfur oxidation DsrE/DsrF family protein